LGGAEGEVLHEIFLLVGAGNLCAVPLVCKKFQAIYEETFDYSRGHAEAGLRAGVFHKKKYPPSRSLCNVAAKFGKLEVLKWARENGCEWSWRTCSEAAENGHLDVLKWTQENGCGWDFETCSAAARSGHLEVLQWAHENGCNWSERTCEEAAR
jgi:hypothetical protein